MADRAAVAVIGGGVIGASIAYHLAREGASDVIIFDRTSGPGLGSSGKATGGFRSQFATPINVRLSLLSRDALLRFEDDTGTDPGYEQVGYLWLAFTREQLGALRDAAAMQKTEGLSEATEIIPEDIPLVNPVITTEGIIGAAFCPTDGYIEPLSMLQGYIEASERLGVKIKWKTPCTGMSLNTNGRITHVRTAAGDIEVDNVVNAAGPWAAATAAMAGVTLPVFPLRRQVALTYPVSTVPGSIPMTIFMDTAFHLRAKLGRVMICWPNPEEPGEPAELAVDDQWIDKVTAMARQHVPLLNGVAIDRTQSYAGLYEMSPDHHAIIGRSVECENLWLANGSSGHGVMHSPAIGSIVADMILGRPPRLDVSSLRPSRFAEGAVIVASELL